MRLFTVNTLPKVTRIHRYMRGRYRKMDRNDGIMLSEGLVPEERLAVTPVVICPFCMERYYKEYYEKRKELYKDCLNHNKPMFEFVRDEWNMKRSNEDVDTYFDRGLDELEVPVKAPHFWQKNEKWFVRRFTCNTCGASYDSAPYRKDHYVNLV